METTDKAEILDSIAGLAKEVRVGFEKLDGRLTHVEEKLRALSVTVDAL
jgi:phage-related tail protein